MRVLHRLLHNYSCSPLLHRQIATAYPVTVLCQLLWPWLSLLPPPAYHLSPHEAFNVAHPNLYKPPNIRTQIRSWYLSGSIACSPTALLGQYHSSSSPPPTHCVGYFLLETIMHSVISSHTVYTQSDGGDPETTESSPPPPPLPPPLVLPGELGDGTVQDGEGSPPPPLPPPLLPPHSPINPPAKVRCYIVCVLYM